MLIKFNNKARVRQDRDIINGKKKSEEQFKNPWDWDYFKLIPIEDVWLADWYCLSKSKVYNELNYAIETTFVFVCV